MNALVIATILLAGLILFVDLTDADISVPDTSIPDSKITTGQTKASNPSAIGIRMIAWPTPSGEGGSNGL